MTRRLPLPRVRSGPGVLTGATLLLIFLGLAVSIDYPRTSLGFKGDEATYYMLAHSIARDADFTYNRHDLTRVWEEFSGPEGVFLKKGADIEGVELTGSLPFVRLKTTPDEARGRLYFAKSYIYPLFAAPFIALFGTNGFLVFHALLLVLNFAAGYAFLCARGTPRPLAAALATVFIFASVVPIYYVSLAPEFFNFTLVLQAYFLWTYKRALPQGPSEGGPHRESVEAAFRRPGSVEAGPHRNVLSEGRASVAAGFSRPGGLQHFLLSPGSDLLAAVLLGIATFSKPTHILLILPLLALALMRRQWRSFLSIGFLFAAVVVLLFGANAAITGEFNYQGGNRKSFYGRTGFPFANTWETFDNRGQGVATDAVPTDVLVHGDTLRVLAWNAMYFAIGRYSGFVPYFFPGVVALALFLMRRSEARSWQWLTLGAALVGAVALLVYMPYTYSGGGGPVGNRYFLSFYPLFLFLFPAVHSIRPLLVALGIGALFTAKLAMNPFYSAFHPGEPAKAGPLRMLPIELTLLNDLPVSGEVERARLRIGGDPPLAAYFPDQGAYPPEGEHFWVRGGSRADVILRVPAPDIPGQGITPLRIDALTVEVTNGAVANRVRVSGAPSFPPAQWLPALGRSFGGHTLDLQPGEVRTVEIRPAGGVPFKPSIYPTNYVYTVSISSSAGSAPFLDTPGQTFDSRYLGVRVRLVPRYRGR